MSAHFDLRRDAAGWTVFDRWTGRPVVVTLIPQIGLALASAEALVRRLNQPGGSGNRRILQ